MAETIRWVLLGTVFSVATWMAFGCSGTRLAQQVPQAQVEPAPPTPIAEKKDELGVPSWDPAWDATIEQSLPPEMLSNSEARAVKPFCPQFQEMSEADRKVFWAYVFQALAGAEAGLKPTTDVRHTEPEVAVKDSVTNRMVRSEGLLQLTYEDSDRYGCDFDWDKDKQLPEKDPQKTILQPENNLKCGIRIMSNQLIDKHKPLATGSSYWSTLRPGTVSYRVFVKQMTNVPSACRVPAPVTHAKKPSDHSTKTLAGTSE
jgi:hypothetical protein